VSPSAQPARKPHLLLISYAFPPALSAESIMVLKKVRVLVRRFAITVVTLDNARGPFPNDPLLEHYVPADVEVVRLPTWDAGRVTHRAAGFAVGALFRNSELIRYFDYRWAADATDAIIERVLPRRRFDVMMTNAQNMCAHLVGLRIRPLLPIPWVQHYSDPFTGMAFGWRHPLSRWVDERYIRRFLDAVHLITMPTAEMAACVFDGFPGERRQSLLRRTAVVPHTYDPEFLESALVRYPDRTRYFTDVDAMHVCYVGNLYGTRGADLVVRAGQRLRSDTGRRTVVHIFGRVGALSKRHLVDSNIVFHRGVDYLESLAVMQHADALLLVDVPRVRSPFFPSKLADYLGTSRPIIAVADPASAVARIARDTRLTLAAWDDEPIRVSTAVGPDELAARAQFATTDRSLGMLIGGLTRLARGASEADTIPA